MGLCLSVGKQVGLFMDLRLQVHEMSYPIYSLTVASKHNVKLDPILVYNYGQLDSEDIF